MAEEDDTSWLEVGQLAGVVGYQLVAFHTVAQRCVS